MNVTFDQIHAALKMRPWIDDALVQRRAEAVFRALTATQWKQFKIEPPEGIPMSGTDKRYPVVHYTFGDQRRSVDNARNPFAVKRALSEMEGTGIDREDIHYFAKVCEIAEALIPHLWLVDAKLTKPLIESDTHLDSLNELWWLARWSQIALEETIYEPRLRKMETKSRFRRKTADWRLRSLDDWLINIEVKNFARAHADRTYDKVPSFYRPNGHTHQGEFDFDDPRLKFRRSSEKEINVLAVTWYDQIGSELETWIEEFLDASAFPSKEAEHELKGKIDAVIIWSRPDQRRDGWRRLFPRLRDISKKRDALMRFLIEPDSEDRNRPWFQTFARSIADAIGDDPRIVRG